MFNLAEMIQKANVITIYSNFLLLCTNYLRIWWSKYSQKKKNNNEWKDNYNLGLDRQTLSKGFIYLFKNKLW